MASEYSQYYFTLQRNITKKISILNFIQSQLEECLAEQTPDLDAIQIYQRQKREIVFDLKQLIAELPYSEQEEYQSILNPYFKEYSL